MKARWLLRLHLHAFLEKKIPVETNQGTKHFIVVLVASSFHF
jgi:hypothetical protein